MGADERTLSSDNLPDRNAEYLLYQTLVGARPIETEWVIAFMEKASREAKVHTSWTNPNPDYAASGSSWKVELSLTSRLPDTAIRSSSR